MSSGKIYSVIFDAPQSAKLLAEDSPDTPLNPNEAAGPTLATAISVGTELATYTQPSGYPKRIGYAAAFRVEEVGQAVKKVSPGDLAFCMGRHVSQQRSTEDRLLRVPDGLTPEIAVFARLMGVSMSTLVTTIARPPSKVLVTGLGIIGHLAAKIFQACGYDVTAAEPLQSRREIALRSGIRDVRPAVPVDDPAFAGHVSLALECSGHEQAALDACRVVKRRGEVVLIATPWRRLSDLYAHELLRAVFHNYVVLRSGWEWEVPVLETEFRAGSLMENFAAALQWLLEKRVTVDGLYTKVPPASAQTIYSDLLSKKSPYLTAVFDWTEIP